MNEDEEEYTGIKPAEDTEMKDGTTPTSGVKPDERDGAGRPRTKKKRDKGNGNGKNRSHSPKLGSRITKPAT